MVDKILIKLSHMADGRILIEDLRNELNNILSFYKNKELELKLQWLDDKIDIIIRKNITHNK